MKMMSLSEDDGMEIKMRKHLTILTAAAMTAVMLTACGSGDGIVINGTTAAESGIVAGETSGEQAEGNTPEETSKTGGTKIEIVTGETTAAVESLEGQTEPETTQEAGKMIISAETAATGTTAAATKAANPTTAAATKAANPTTAAATKAAAPTTAAATYTVKDVSKTMYASSSVRVRSGYSTSTDVLGALSAGEKVTVTGEVENGWVRVTYKGHTAYVAKGMGASPFFYSKSFIFLSLTSIRFSSCIRPSSLDSALRFTPKNSASAVCVKGTWRYPSESGAKLCK